MPLRRKRRSAPAAVAHGFAEVAGHVDRAKSALLATVPSPRGVPGPPLAEAIAAFEAALRDADAAMAAWRSPETEEIWEGCRVALREALAAAERLRLQAPALDYEGLVGVLADLLDPLDAFDDAERAVRRGL